MDGTLKQLLAEIYACHRELEQLRARVKELEAALASRSGASGGRDGARPEERGG